MPQKLYVLSFFTLTHAQFFFTKYHQTFTQDYPKFQYDYNHKSTTRCPKYDEQLDAGHIQTTRLPYDL